MIVFAFLWARCRFQLCCYQKLSMLFMDSISDNRIWNITKRVQSNLIIFHFFQTTNIPAGLCPISKKVLVITKFAFLKLIIVQKIKRR